MKRQFAILTCFLALCAAPAAAQDLASPVCPAGTSTAGIPDATRAAQDACQQAYDIYQFMSPQLGLALAGGNATLGVGGTLGGLGHFSIGVRGNAFSGMLPDVTTYSQDVNGAQRRTLETKTQFIGLPTADAEIGLFKGIPLGLSNVGGVDALVSAAYVPTIDADGISITPKQNLQLGYGARIGLLQESLLVPGVSVTYLKRDLPETDIVGSAGSNSFAINNFKVKTTAWRLTASKSFILFNLAAGVGQDNYDQSADISATVHSTNPPVDGTSTIPGTSQSMKRTNYFLDAGLNLPLIKIVAELGQVSGGTVATYNSFSGGRADRSQTYFSAGVRFAF
jgi:hypothetical protein